MTTTKMITSRGWVDVDLPGGCTDWNDSHDCGRELDHPGDHVCVGCHDQWNRGPGDVEQMDDGDEDYFREQRDFDHPLGERCADS